MRAYVESWGSLAPAAFISLQTLQVVLAPVPGEFTGAVGGFLFGGFPTTIYSTIGLTLGSTLAFLGARIIGQPLVKLVVPPRTMNRFQFLTERKGTLLALVLFIIHLIRNVTATMVFQCLPGNRALSRLQSGILRSVL